MANQFGLGRTIPADVRREVRSRCKFGCVLCRRGLYTYEHIEPTFADARTHDPNAICCLCASCHEAVTRGHTAKQTVMAAYRRVSEANATDVGPPIGPLDFSDGNAHLIIGALDYYPAVRTVLKYHGDEVIRVDPSSLAGEPGAISASFTDDAGRLVLRLERNEWLGSTEAWDIEVTGARLTVRKRSGVLALQLRMDPPGRIVIERLDMRIGDAHVLATDASYAIGRYVGVDEVEWMHAQLTVTGSRPEGAAFEFTTPDALTRRVKAAAGSVQSAIYVIGGEGAMLVSHGMCIGSGCTFAMREWAMGPRRVSEMREVLIGNFGRVPMFIATGKTSNG